MKKLLSLVLVFAIVLSCISMVSIFAGDENVGVKLTAKNNVTGTATAFTNANAGFTTADVVDGYIVRDFTVHNPNSYEVKVCIQYRNGWGDLILKGDKKEVTISGGSKEDYRLAIPVNAEGNIDANGTMVPLADVVLRVDVKTAMNEGDSIYVECAAGDAAYNLTSSYFTISSVTEIPPFPAVTAGAYDLNGDAENGTENWGVWNGGSIESVTDPKDAGN